MAPDPAHPDSGDRGDRPHVRAAPPTSPHRDGSSDQSGRRETAAHDLTLLQVGSIVKPHGLKGDVIVRLTTNRPERVAPGSVLHASHGRQFRVVRSSSHRGRFIVCFEGVSGIDQAEGLRDTELLAPPLVDDDALWVHELIGSQVEDRTGRILGTVEEVEANPASDLLVLDGGALIPLRFVVGTEPGVRVTVDVPDGLLDLA